MTGRARFAPAGAAVLLLAALAPSAAIHAATPVETTFTSTGGEQTFVVPEGVTTIHVVAIGAPGGAAVGSGGAGARVEGDLAVVAGDTLYVNVGGQGGDAGGAAGGIGGFNGGGTGGSGPTGGSGGGGGGGASDVRTVARSVGGSLDARLLTAGGGGGGAGGENAPFGGAAGAPGGNGNGGGGEPGTDSAGGAGGVAASPATPGAAGAQGTGGDAGSAPTSGDPVKSGGGGGGGAGVFGGGGGGGGNVGSGGGGGGGSSSVGSLTNASVTADATRVPSITFTYELPASTGVVDAVVTVPTPALCLDLSTTSIDFGSVPLGSVNQPAGSNVVLGNCSTTRVSVYVRATDATGTNAAWTLDDTDAACTSDPPLAPDRYHLGLGALRLSTSSKLAGSLGTTEVVELLHTIDTACPGSSGSGATMSLQITYLIAE